MKTLRLFLCLLLGLISTSSYSESDFRVDDDLSYCHRHLLRALAELRNGGDYDFTMEPRNILSTDHQIGWNVRKATAEEWCSGFWPGILWMDYIASGDTVLLRPARGYTESLRGIAYRPVFDHDIGFLMMCSYGKGYEVSRNDDYRQVLLASADSLATLFNPVVGTLLSWPREVKPRHWPHNTIMDNMINLDLMFWAAKHGGNPLLYDLAVTHAMTTMRHHFRSDGSCYHVAVYDTISGDFIKGVTHQGYADYSMWSRGQSWAIYGYTMVYRYTHKQVFLDFAQKVTDIYLKRLSETSDDMIPVWDMDAPDRNVKDASAACVVADALLELQGYVKGEKQQRYREAAVKMLKQLAGKRYRSGKRNVSFLLHSTGHHPAGSEIDASIIYADYYYLEALLRAKALNL
ncbi:MAG: glycoside hydrolase family 88 protein [Prevotella sp.]|nr:glycoside hydrolase family 88 protein [Prevotella sp.]